MLENIYLDIEYFVLLIDRVWLKKYLFDVIIRKIASSIIVRELRSAKHQTNKYMILLIYLLGKFKNNINIIAKTASREIYLIDKLKIKMLIEMNIIKSKEIDILISRSSILIFSYKIEVSIKLKLKERTIR